MRSLYPGFFLRLGLRLYAGVQVTCHSLVLIIVAELLVEQNDNARHIVTSCAVAHCVGCQTVVKHLKQTVVISFTQVITI